MSMLREGERERIEKRNNVAKNSISVSFRIDDDLKYIWKKKRKTILLYWVLSIHLKGREEKNGEQTYRDFGIE